MTERASTVAPPRESSGYAHELYARSLAHMGEPIALARSGGWLIRRPVPGGGADDATGPYPLFSCRDWSGLAEDLAGLEGELVSAVLVADPLAPPDRGTLERAFSVIRPFKEHFVVDLELFGPRAIAKGHRHETRRALRSVEVERCDPPIDHLAEWTNLYAVLVRRHAIHGPAAFSSRAFELQLQVPGMELFRAVRRGRTVAMAMWCVGEGAVHYHLAAATPAGYRTGASYALVWRALEHYAERVRLAGLGSVPGPDAKGSKGLAHFKRGWATGTRTAPLCGRVLDPDRHDELAAAAGAPERAWFPVYRAGER